MTKSDTSVSGQSFKAKKPRHEDDAFALRRPRASKVFNRVQREKGKGSGGLAGGMPKKPLISHAHPVRPSPRGLALRSASRRCTVKVNYVANRKAGQWAAHGRYLDREGAQREGEIGQGFNAAGDEVSLSSEMHKWQMEGDQRLFKIVVSPEDGDRLQMKAYTREFMARLGAHIGKGVAPGTGLEWAAIDHYNTGHPHTHVVLRGKDNLQISPDLIRQGMRKIAEEIATERLGYKSELEIQKSKEKEIDARQFTGIDKDIQEKQLKGPEPDKTYVTEERLTPDAVHTDFVAQRLRIRRLETLEKLGVAEKVGGMTWALDAGWDKALKDLQVLQRRTAMVAQGRALMTDPRCPPVVTKPKPGDHLVGRVLGTGMDEQYDRSYILIEGTDSRVHIVYQNNAIEKQRAEQKLQPRSLVAISGKSFTDKAGKTIAFQKVTEYDLVIPDQHFKSVKIPEQALDDALDAGLQPNPNAVTGFQAVWHQQLRDRQLALQTAALQKAREKERLEKERQDKAKKNGRGKGIE
jgi:type IV secretory pathway VirD2 relaxase